MRLLSILCHLLWLSGTALAQQPAKEVLEKTYPLAPSGLVVIENINGSLRVEGWDKEEVKVVAEKMLTETERIKLADLEVRIQASTNAVFIDTEYPRNNYHSGDRYRDYVAEVNYTLYLPRRATLRSKLINSDVRVQGMTANLDINTINGTIECPLLNMTDDAHVELESVNGRVMVTLGKDYSGTIEARNVHGRIRSDISNNYYKSEPFSKHFQATLGTSRQELRVRNVNGGVEITR